MARKPLSQLWDWELVDEEQDLRGRKLLDRDGALLGTISDMLVDTESGYVEGIILEGGTTYGAREFELRQGAAVLLEAAQDNRRQSARGQHAPSAPGPPVSEEGELAAAQRTPRDVVEDVTTTRPADVTAPIDPRSDVNPVAPERPVGGPGTMPKPRSESRVEQGPPIIIRLRGEELYAERVAVIAREIVIDKRAVRFTGQITDTVRREEVEVVSSTAGTPAAAREQIAPAASEPRRDPPGP